MDTKRLISILRGAADFASDDNVTRRHLTHLHVPTANRIEATDGHRLVRIDCETPHGLPVGYVDPKAALARVKANAPVELVPDDAKYPDFDNVLAGTDAVADKPEPIGINPILLADVAGALANVIGAGAKVSRACKVNVRGKLDPIRFDAASSDGVRAVALLMPMRY